MSLAGSYLLLSIHPEYAEMIFLGQKKIELRKRRPKRVSEGDSVIVYASYPTMAILGGFEVKGIIEDSPVSLWAKVQNKSGISESDFFAYYAGNDKAYGILVHDPWTLDNPISLDTIREIWPNFHPPQSFHYLSSEQVDLLREV